MDDSTLRAQPRYREVFLVKLSGFPPWPARRSCPSEWNPSVQALEARMPKSQEMVFFFGSHDYTAVSEKQIQRQFSQEDADAALGRSKVPQTKKSKSLAAAFREAARWFETPFDDRVFPEFVEIVDSEPEAPLKPAPKVKGKRLSTSKAKVTAPALDGHDHDDEGFGSGSLEESQLADSVYPRKPRGVVEMRKRVWRRHIQRRIGLFEQNKDSVREALRDAKKISFPRNPAKRANVQSAAAPKRKSSEAAAKNKNGNAGPVKAEGERVRKKPKTDSKPKVKSDIGPIPESAPIST